MISPKKGKEPVSRAEATIDLKDITQYRSVGVTDLRDNIKEYLEGDDTGPILVYRRSDPKKVLVDYDTWMQILRNLDAGGGEELKAIARSLQKLVK